MKWFREWRAWVKKRRRDREQELIRIVWQLADSNHPMNQFISERIIHTVRRHDRSEEI